jgi:hypothetical protein
LIRSPIIAIPQTLLQAASVGVGWYSPSWLYRQRIRVPNTSLTADLTDFPVYVNLNNMSAGFFTNVKSDGGDIRVTKADGVTEVPRDLVFITTGSSIGELHFKADGVLSSTANNDFYIYYGNAGASNPAAGDPFGRNNTWNSGYVLVAHCQELPNGTAPQIIDSTSNSNNGTSVGSMTSGDSVAGKLAGQGLDFDGVNDFIRFGNAASLQMSTNLTVELWVNGVSSNQQGFVGKGGTTLADNSWLIGSNTNVLSGSSDVIIANATPAGAGNSKLYRAGSVVFDSTWRHVALTFAANDLKTFVNGSNDTGSRTQIWNATVNSLHNTPEQVKLGGSLLGSGGNFKAFIGDEFRLSNVTRTPEWIAASYSNQNAPASFYTVSAQEAL